MSTRKAQRALARWEMDTRAWATQSARDLVLDIYEGRPLPITPYRVGVVLFPGERVWAEIPARFPCERPPLPWAGRRPWQPPLRPWLVTTDRVVGRLGDDRLYGWRWEDIIGCRIELAPQREWVTVDAAGSGPVTWIGPGVAPLAVAAVYRLHGPAALLEHPALACLRSRKVALISASRY